MVRKSQLTEGTFIRYYRFSGSVMAAAYGTILLEMHMTKFIQNPTKRHHVPQLLG